MRRSNAQLRVLCLLVALVAASCSPSPLENLSEAERAYVIPNSSEWGKGDPCEGDCAGPLTIDGMLRLCWAEIDPISWNVSAEDGQPFSNGFFEITRTLRGPTDDVVLGMIGNERAEWLDEANIASHRLILGTECPAQASSETLIQEIIAIDGQGRIAGIGFGAELFTTLPIAQGAAADGAATAEEYLMSVLSS